jgi:preprotein translocase subunit SecD
VLASKAVNLLAALVLYFVAVGNVRGFAFTLGLTAIADLVVVFMFTHPVLRLLAKTKFFGEGHPWSGLDPRRLGGIPLYRGAGRLREPGEKPVTVARTKNKGASAEAERRLTIAERRRAEQQKALAGRTGSPTAGSAVADSTVPDPTAADPTAAGTVAGRAEASVSARTGSTAAGRTGSSQKETKE